MSIAHKNASRFGDFAGLYDRTRPACPAQAADLLLRYLRRQPQTVVDLGCGTGLSTLIWADRARCVIGVEPSEGMLTLAKQTAERAPNLRFVQAFSDRTGLESRCADIVTCAQSFHWMEPVSTLREINRLLKPGGLFAAYDCDWPPVACTEVELAYDTLFAKVSAIETQDADFREAFVRYPKEQHLANLRESGYFSYVREIIFSNTEFCDGGRFIHIALTQGGLQAILTRKPELLEPELQDFRLTVGRCFGETTQEIVFCYRLRLGVK
ncbi:MAG: class I SAM-dependent methyltransferase [Oscillospiraceae bacterium]|jgi:ubiquinone/menaquinone biosynthesis C-methylase UbiE|nr:class I SAM-dependent methyltransferase [Oscillospiraceae bacterium]